MLERGRTIAEGRCGPCHATGLDDESPHRITPPLRVLHERYPIEMLQRAAETGVVDGHDEMPMFRFSMPDTQALLAYIDSLAPDKPGYASGSGTTPK